MELENENNKYINETQELTLLHCISYPVTEENTSRRETKIKLTRYDQKKKKYKNKDTKTCCSHTNKCPVPSKSGKRAHETSTEDDLGEEGADL